ncbi:MAG: polysaccharide biosynthesis/export family protein [Deltaproteobacteria bacterium]|nr:polysaccharide biosynthesis/export family protein [Deltaproteobacteria bacterium]
MTQYPNPRRWAADCMVAILLLSFAGCSEVGRNLPPPGETYALTQAAVTRSDYRLQAGDRLNIKFPYHTKHNQELPIRPDGKITLEPTGEIIAEGLTPLELEDLIKQRSSRVLKNPEVVVIVTQIGDRRAFVGGEVGRPGFVAVQEGMTPLQAVLAAGGFKDTARKDSVLYIARGATGAYQASRVDLDAVVRNGVAETVRLTGSDVVYVPATRIANLDTFVDQYIRKVMPVDSRAGATAPIPIP